MPMNSMRRMQLQHRYTYIVHIYKLKCYNVDNKYSNVWQNVCTEYGYIRKYWRKYASIDFDIKLPHLRCYKLWLLLEIQWICFKWNIVCYQIYRFEIVRDLDLYTQHGWYKCLSTNRSHIRFQTVTTGYRYISSYNWSPPHLKSLYSSTTPLEF